MKRLLSMLGFLAIMLSTSAKALDISYSNINPFNGENGEIGKAETLLLKGEITPGDYEHLLKVIRSDQVRFWKSVGFVLSSPGGDLQEAMKIARLVKGTYSRAFVGSATGNCVSACFFIYVSAVHRLAVSGSIGIHRPYLHPQKMVSLSAYEAEKFQNNVLRQARSYLENLDVPTGLVDKMFQRASTEVYWLSSDEIDEQLGIRPPWYEQFLIARCGLNKSIERKKLSNNTNETNFDDMAEVENCGSRLSMPEATAFLSSELKSTSQKKAITSKK